MQEGFKNSHTMTNLHNIVHKCHFILTPTSHMKSVITQNLLYNGHIAVQSQQIPIIHTPKSWLHYLHSTYALSSTQVLSPTDVLFLLKKMNIKNHNINLINKTLNLIYQEKNPSPGSLDINPNQAFIARLMEELDATLIQYQCTTLFQAYHSLNNQLQNDSLLPPERSIACIGFTNISPVLEEHLKRLGQHHQLYYYTPITIPHKPIKAYTYSTPTDEYTGMLQWAKEHLQTNPNAKLAALCMGQVDRSLIESLYHHPLFTNTDLAQKTHITSFQTLNQYPIIHTALSILKIMLDKPPISTEDWVDLLKSPFIGSSFSQVQMLQKWAHELSMQGIAFLPNHLALKPQKEQTLWQALTPLLTDLNSKQTLQVWGKHFQAILTTWHWPGPTPLNSRNQQTLMAWDKAWLHWQSLTRFIEDQISAEEALSHLIFCVEQQTFQPKDATDASLHIMPFDNFLGLNADHVWIMHAQAHLLPPPPIKNDYLNQPEEPIDPLPIFKKAGTSVTFSAHSLADGIAQTVSPAIEPFLQPNDQSFDHALPNSVKKTIEDHGVKTNFPHSTQNLSRYTECPFRGVFEHTVANSIPPIASIGLTAAQRGTLIHEILHHTWQTIKTHETLLTLTPQARFELTSPLIAKSLEALKKLQPSILPAGFWQEEQKRLETLIDHWLALETQRSPFEVIATELPITYTLNDATFSLRLDRLDRDEVGQHWIIDYKTGLAHPSDWFSDRPSQPQMPLYALAIQKPLAGLAYGIIRNDGMHLRGLSSNQSNFRGLDTIEGDWQSMLQAWHDTLAHQIHQIQQGIATIDPKSTQSCQYCTLPSVCRYHVL